PLLDTRSGRRRARSRRCRPRPPQARCPQARGGALPSGASVCGAAGARVVRPPLKVALLLWPDTFEDWYAPLEIDRTRYLQDYERLRFDVAAPVLRVLRQRVVAVDVGGSSRPLRHPLHRFTTRCAHRLLAVHQAEASRARRMLRHPDVGVWPVPVRTDVFRPQDRRSARRTLGIDL